ncbi:MAG: helix-turn-helix domain-containing protein [Candidatus Riflebacteria bacterium]|nr:helix-turn-helix domain-containing protein [Candidatus Riflebacteria bacterium]
MKKERCQPAEAARYLGVSRSTLFKYIREGRLRPVRLSSRKIYLEREQLDTLLEPEDVVWASAGLWGQADPRLDGVAYVEKLRRGPGERSRRRRVGAK